MPRTTSPSRTTTPSCWPGSGAFYAGCATRYRSRELALGDITLTPRKREATVRGRRVALSPTESRFLATLAASMPAAVATEQLLHKSGPTRTPADPAYVWVTVRRLRQKLEFDPDHPIHLLTEPGGGYRLAAGELRPGTDWATRR